LATSLATPVPFDAYLRLADPLWSRRGADLVPARVTEVIAETDRASTIVLKPGRGLSRHVPGQWIDVSVEIDGVRHRRCYSLTSVPGAAGGLISITTQRIPDGIVSGHLTRAMRPGTIVYLGQPSGEFVLPAERPPTLFITGGSGITPVMGMLRSLAERGPLVDIAMLHHAPDADDSIFASELAALADAHDGFRIDTTYTGPGAPPPEAELTVVRLDRECPDWRERHTWACGPGPLLDAATEIWQHEGIAERLHLESFRPPTLPLDPDAAGGCVRFVTSGVEVEAEPNEPILLAAERAGLIPKSGCRQGICRTCVRPMLSGHVTDLRDGRIISEPGTYVQICINTATGDVDLDL